MAIPDYQSLMLPVLRLLRDRNEHSLTEMRKRLAVELKLSSKEMAERLPSGMQAVFASRIQWAAQYLKSAAAIESVGRGLYRITDRGLSLLKQRPPEITVKTLRQFSEFNTFHRKKSTRSGDS
jgi:restriction system protein